MNGYLNVKHLLILAPALFSSTMCFSEVILDPNSISGQVQFINENQEILNLIDSRGNKLGLHSLSARARSVGFSETLSSTAYFPVEGQVAKDIEFFAATAESGIQYQVDYTVDAGLARNYKFPSVLTERLYPMPADGVDASSESCAAVANVSFVDEGGLPFTVKTATTFAYPESSTQTGAYGGYQSYNYEYDTNTAMLAFKGTDRRTKLYTRYWLEDDTDYYCTNYVAGQCDQIVSASCTVVPVAPPVFGVGGVKGKVMFESENLAELGTYQKVTLSGGPDNIHITHRLNSDMSFLFNDIVESSKYRLQTSLLFRKGYSTNYFSSPLLQRGINGSVIIRPDQVADIGNKFLFTPGYVSGLFELVGPAAPEGSTGLQYLYRDGDKLNDLGVPVNHYLRNSSIASYGTSQKAEGATYNSRGGAGKTGFSGQLDAESGVLSGEYSLALSGLNGQGAVWTNPLLSLYFINQDFSEKNGPYMFSTVRVSANTTDSLQVMPEQNITQHHQYCMNDVKLNYRTTSGKIYQPSLSGTGLFNEEDYNGDIANYGVNVTASGLPLRTSASETGAVNMSLPQGTYTLKPQVYVQNNGNSNRTLLPSVTLDVGCGQVIDAGTNIQVSVNTLPTHTEVPVLHIQGKVNSHSPVARLDYRVNDNPEVLICRDDCSEEGSFDIEVPLMEGVNHIVVTATDINGEVASVSSNTTYTEPEPVNNCDLDDGEKAVSLALSQNMLWPPNNKMALLSYSVESDCDSSFASSINTEVFSNESNDEKQAKPFLIDALMDNSGMSLRAERLGKGNGRIYLVRTSGVDLLGQVYHDCRTVTVPHDKSKAAIGWIEAEADRVQEACAVDGLIPETYKALLNK